MRTFFPTLFLTLAVLPLSCARNSKVDANKDSQTEMPKTNNQKGIAMHLVPQKDATVVVSGVVKLGPQWLKEDKEPREKKQFTGRSGVAVYITDIPNEWHFDTPTKPVVLHFRDGKIVPFTCCVQVLQPLHVIAQDDQDHILDVASKCQHQYAKLRPKDFRRFNELFGLPEEGLRLVCADHQEEAYVTVVSHPFFAVTKDDGTFRLPRALPPGTYTIRAYYPGWGHAEKQIPLKGDVEETSVELHLFHQGEAPLPRFQFGDD